MAPRTLLTISASFSCWSARRSRPLSSVPEVSPAATRLTYTRLKTFGCLARAALKAEPASTSVITWLMTTLSGLLVVCCVDAAQALHQRQAGVDKRRQLAAEQHLVLGLDARETADRRWPLCSAVMLDRRQALLADQLGGRLLAVGLDLWP